MIIYGAGADSDTQDLLNCDRPIRGAVHMAYSATSSYFECGILIISFRLESLNQVGGGDPKE